VDAWVGHKVGLELRNINVQGTVEAKRSSQGGNNLGNKSVQVGVSRSLNVQISAAHIIQSLVIKTESAISVLEEGMGGQDVVVGLNNCGRHLGGRGNSEGELGLAAIIDRESLEKKRTQSRTSTTTSGMENHESLKTSAVISQLSHAIKNKINNFLSDGVMTTGIVIGGIFFTRDELLRMVKLSVSSSADFVHHTGLKINHDGTRNMFTSSSLREEGVEGVITTTNSLVGGHLAVRLDSVLKAIEFPASITGLDTSLTNMDR